jgi:putative ATPase
MKELGYSKGYKYAHDFDDALTDQENLPQEIEGSEYFMPKEAGREGKLKEYLDWFKKRRDELRRDLKSE